MDLSTKLRSLDLQSSFVPASPILVPRKSRFLPSPSSPSRSIRILASVSRRAIFSNAGPSRILRIPAVATETAVAEPEPATDLESLFSDSSDSKDARIQAKKKPGTGASGVSSGIRLENISKSYKGVTVLKDVSWEVKKGEKVVLVGVNGAGKTTQMRIIAGLEEPDSGNVIKAKENMKIAFLSQEFEVCGSWTVKEEFLNAFKEEMEIAERLEKVQSALDNAVEDLNLMGRLLDELDLLQRRAQDGIWMRWM